MWWPKEELRGQSKLIKLDVLDAMPYELPETAVENRPFYTPAQIAEIMNAKVHSNIPQMDRLDRAERDDGIPEVDLVESEVEVG
jgi:hypothetical protein